MRRSLFFVFVLALVSLPLAAGDNEPLIDVKKFDFSLSLDIRYATSNNFTKHRVYPEARCILRKPVAEAVARVQNTLKLKGMKLKLFDCYRPLSVQKKFWELVPDERYVADPQKGSRHNRGAAVDLTLIDLEGKELQMPSGYDDFSEKAHRNYQKATKTALANRKTLEAVMEKEGFQGLETEWWHFDFKGWEQYSIEDIPFSSIP